MIRVLLCCAGGMSTSFLARKVQKEVLEKRLDVDVQAADQHYVMHHLKDVDVVLIGPHLSYLKPVLENAASPYGTAVGLIEGKTYGNNDASALLEQILKIEVSMPQQEGIEQVKEEEEQWTPPSHFKSYFTREMLEALRWKL